MASTIRHRNEGSLFQRSNRTWRAQISVNGRRISKSFKSKAEGLNWLRTTQTEIDRGLDYQAGRITLGEFLNQWLETIQPVLRATTIHQYQIIAAKHIIPRIGKVKLKDLRLDGIEKYYAELIQDGVGIRTIRVVHNILHKSLEKAVRYGMIMRNPSHGADQPRYKTGEMQVLDENQAAEFLIVARDSPYRALYHLALTTGMRQGELFGLKWTDLQWHSGNLHIQRQVQNIPGKGSSFVEPKTRAGKRTIKLGEGTLQVLREHREQQCLRREIAGCRWKENDLIFPSSVGTPGDPSNLRVDFLKVLANAGLPQMRFHDLRHTAASLLLNHNVPVIVVSKMLGHSKPSITLDVYGHLYHESQHEAARVMDDLITPVRVNLPVTTEQVSRNAKD